MSGHNDCRNSNTVPTETETEVICMETYHCTTMTETAQTLKARDYKDPQVICFNISPYGSNCMKSDNPHSGIQEVETARTLDLNGGNPSCNQGGVMICEPRA